MYNDMFSQSTEQVSRARDVVGRRNMHQVQISMLYNKVVLLHLNPCPPGLNVPPVLHIYELDPSYSQRVP